MDLFFIFRIFTIKILQWVSGGTFQLSQVYIKYREIPKLLCLGTNPSQSRTDLLPFMDVAPLIQVVELEEGPVMGN